MSEIPAADQFPDYEVELVQEGRDVGVSAKLREDDRVTVDVEFGDALTFVFGHTWLDAACRGSVPARRLTGVLSIQRRLWISWSGVAETFRSYGFGDAASMWRSSSMSSPRSSSSTRWSMCTSASRNSMVLDTGAFISLFCQTMTPSFSPVSWS